MAGGSNAARRWAQRLEAGTQAIAAVCRWAVLAVLLLTFGLVAVRYALARGSIATQELVLHLNALVFLLGGAWALVADRHVRVDIFQQRWGARRRAAVELAGIALLLLPFCIFWFWISLDYVAAAWRVREGSREAGGLPGVYLVKTLMPLAAALLALAGVARGLRQWAVLREAPPGDDAAAGAVAEAKP